MQGIRLAWKKVVVSPKSCLTSRKEVEVLRKLSHIHMIQLVGTYTHKHVLGMLLFPVAVCDLKTFFDDVEAHWTTGTNETQRTRLATLGYYESMDRPFRASPAYSQIGCLISTIAYLHSHELQIRHKDIKPSNILLTPHGLYLSDFGSATDFSELSKSATDNARGTLRYCAPEVSTNVSQLIA